MNDISITRSVLSIVPRRVIEQTLAGEMTHFTLSADEVFSTARMEDGSICSAERVMKSLRAFIKHSGWDMNVEVAHVPEFDGKRIVFFREGMEVPGMTKTRLNTLSSGQMTLLAMLSMGEQVAPYESIDGTRITRSNLSTANKISEYVMNYFHNNPDEYKSFINSILINGPDLDIKDLIRTLEHTKKLAKLKSAGFSEDEAKIMLSALVSSKVERADSKQQCLFDED